MRSFSRLRLPGVFAAALLGATAIAFVGVSAAATPPFEPDTTNQIGQLAFYDATGNVVTSGNVSDHPFAAFAVALNDKPAGNSANKATLYGYLPVTGVAPGNWSGEQLSASTTFPVASPASVAAFGANRPVATHTADDLQLSDLVTDFPHPAGDTGTANEGLYQMRLQIAGESKWWVADIKINGSTWTQVYPTVTAPTTSPTTTTLAATPTSPQTLAAAGDPASAVTLTATVTANVAGSVQFLKNGTAFGTPVAASGGATNTATMTATPDAPASGAGPVTTSYTATFTPADTAANSPSTSTALAYVVQNPAAPVIPPTTTTLEAAPAGPQTLTVPGDPASPVTLTATETPAVAGSVEFFDGTTSLGVVPVTAGAATKIVTPGSPTATSTTPATTTYTATFTPTDTAANAPSTSSPLAYVVQNPPAAVTTTELVVTPAGSLPDDDVSLTATVANSATPATIPVGTVSWFDNGSTTPLNSTPVPVDSAGHATFDMPTGIGAGDHSVVATFTPTNAVLFAASTSTAGTFTTQSATVTTTLTLTVDPPGAAAGSAVTLTAHVASGTVAPNFSAHVAAPITGTVTFLDGSTTLGTAAVTDGVATFTIDAISAGSHSFSAQFSGDTGFTDSTTTAVLASPRWTQVQPPAGAPCQELGLPWTSWSPSLC